MNTEPQVNIMLVDDQLSFRELLGSYFSYERTDFHLVGHSRTGAEALEQVDAWHPDFIIADVFLPDMPAHDFLKKVHEIDAHAAVIAFCRWLNEESAISLVHCGVRGIVVKDQSLSHLLAAITAVRNGGCYIPAALETAVFGRKQTGQVLTEREVTALRLIAEGFATKQVGDQMNISVKTAEKYRERIMAKLRLHDVVSLTRYAIRHGFATL